MTYWRSSEPITVLEHMVTLGDQNDLRDGVLIRVQQLVAGLQKHRASWRTNTAESWQIIECKFTGQNVRKTEAYPGKRHMFCLIVLKNPCCTVQYAIGPPCTFSALKLAEKKTSSP